MMSVQEAKKKVREVLFCLPRVRLPLEKALFRVLAQDIRAPICLPLYDNSAMDGFALRSEDTGSASSEHPLSLKIMGTQKAGDPPTLKIKSGELVRIMTGATIPKGADAVVMKERVEEKEGKIFISTPVLRGNNIRKRGEEIQKGSLILPAGTFLNSRSLGLLANLGLKKIPVRKTPKVSLIITGSELVSASQKRRHGQIYDSNSPLLLAALREIHLKASFVKRVKDDEEKLKRILEEAFQKTEVVLVVGGVSVGDYDFSKQVFRRLGVKTIFWSVAQKPGKPLFFGKKGRRLLFGLPGNPVSAWVCFHEYVIPALLGLQGSFEFSSKPFQAILEKAVKPDFTKTLFLRGNFQSHNGQAKVEAFTGQGSHMLKSLAEANCLIQIPPQKDFLTPGSRVEARGFVSLRAGGYR